ncbi:MAG: hypothetical protein JXQ96_21610 [Cyclobacteriaceae bacterium]
MIKIFRNIRKQILEKGNIRKYVIYAIGEIFLVVVGILIALSINNWNNRKTLRQTELKVYNNIRNQINEDRNLLMGVIDYNKLYIEQYDYANQIITRNDRKRIDTLARIIPNIYNYSDFNRTGNIFQNLVNSGDLKLLKNSTIVERIQSLEELYIYVNRLEENHFKVILEFGGKGIIDNINFSTGEIERPMEIYSFKFQNILISFIDISEEKDEIYERALREIDVISNLIEKELQE